MEIKATDEQEREFLEDYYADIQVGNYRVYLELNADGSLWYAELVKSKNGKTEQGYAFDTGMLEKMIPKRPSDSRYYHNEPLCPNCQTYMIYKFEYCPKCGQKLDWSEK